MCLIRLKLSCVPVRIYVSCGSVHVPPVFRSSGLLNNLHCVVVSPPSSLRRGRGFFSLRACVLSVVD